MGCRYCGSRCGPFPGLKDRQRGYRGCFADNGVKEPDVYRAFHCPAFAFYVAADAISGWGKALGLVKADRESHQADMTR